MSILYYTRVKTKKYGLNHSQKRKKQNYNAMIRLAIGKLSEHAMNFLARSCLDGRHHIRPAILPAKRIPAVSEAVITITASLLQGEWVVLIVQNGTPLLILNDTPKEFC